MSNQLESVIIFDPQRCNQCHGCEIACKNWREQEAGLFYRRVVPWWESCDGGERMRTLSLSCLHCVDPACVASCPVSAITKNEQDGRVKVDETLCIGCGACVDVCDYGVPQITAQRVMKKCDLCQDTPYAHQPPCVDSCPGQALTLKKITKESKRDYQQWCLDVVQTLP